MTRQIRRTFAKFTEEIMDRYEGNIYSFSEADERIEGYLDCLQDMGFITYTERLELSTEAYEDLQAVK